MTKILVDQFGTIVTTKEFTEEADGYLLEDGQFIQRNAVAGGGTVLDVTLPADFYEKDYVYINGQFVESIPPTPPEPPQQ